MMKLFLISQSQNNDYDTYDSAVVAAPDEETARFIDPNDGSLMTVWNRRYSTWCNDPKHVNVEYIGEAADHIEQGVICASFNAG